jgi:hypothetical protein
MHKPILITLFVGAIFATVGCNKSPIVQPAPLPIPDNPAPLPTPADPAMDYLSLNDITVAYGQPGKTVDLNKDNRSDLYFGVQLVGDPVSKTDKRQFIVVSNFYTSLPIAVNEQVAPHLKDALIPLGNYSNANWYNASEIVLVERVEKVTGQISWRGNWLTAQKQYLPVQILQADKRFNGWVEVSFDLLNQQLVLHRAALSKQPETEIKAGR